MPERKYYWIKLKTTFFQSKEIKKLRKTAGGDTFVIIYLKMQLLSLETGGRLYFEGIEDDFAEELALALDEDSDNVRMTLAFLQNYHLIEQDSAEEYTLPEAIANTGKESASAERVRKLRQRKIDENSPQALQCNGQALQCNIDVTQALHECNTNVTKCNTEKEKEIDIDIDSDFCARTRTRENEGPTAQEVENYCKLINAKINPKHFWAHYEEQGWKDSTGRQILNWKAVLNRWNQGEAAKPSQQQPEAGEDWEWQDNQIFNVFKVETE